MLINQSNLKTLFDGFSAAFNKGFTGAETAYTRIAMTIPSSTREQTYGWLAQLPKMREWLGDRVVNNLAAHGYKIVNRDFENTVGVPRNDIEDDQYGIFAPLFSEMGRAAAEMPDELVFGLLAEGFTTPCYDGQNFFDTDHPVGDGKGGTVSVSNMQAGAAEPWFLLDCSKAIRPMIFQERRKLGNLVSKTEPTDDNVFFKKEYVYGTDGRCNVGYGLWQLAFGSKAELTPENYEAARKAMMSLTGDAGRKLGIKPDTLVCGPNNEGAAMRLLNNGTRIVVAENSTGEETPVAVQNEWAGTAKPIVTPWLPAAA